MLNKKQCPVILVMILFSIVLYWIFGQATGISFLIGFILGCMNFGLLSIESYYLVTSQIRGTKYIHVACYLLRYTALIFFVYMLVKEKELEGFALVAGMLSINFIIVASAFYRHYFKKAVHNF
jgi:hypothetical protein